MPDPSRNTSMFGGMGDLSLPMEVGDVTDSLDALDPGQSILIDLFEAAFNAELGEVWAKVAAETHGFANTMPVEDTLEMAPDKATVQQRKCKFPLLCVHRDGKTTFDEVTLSEERATQQWLVHYILGAIDIVDDRKLAAVFTRVWEITQGVIRQRGHKAYRNGELQFFPGRGGFSSIHLDDATAGAARFSDDDQGPIYQALTMTITTTEKSREDVTQYPDAEGMELSVGVGNTDEILPDLIQGDSTILIQNG